MELKKGYKQTEIGVIPEDWDVKPFSDISLMKGRIGWQGLKKEEFNNKSSDPFLITGMNFKDGEIRWDEVYHVSEDRYQIAKDIQLKNGDVLMTKDGTIGKLLFVSSIPYPHKATLNSHLLLFRPKNNIYNSKYLYYLLHSDYFKQFIENNKSGTTFFGISQESVGKYPVILPLKDEQKQIAITLTDTDQLIQNLKTLITKKKSIKQGAMQELLTGKKRLQGFTKKWETKKLGDICAFQNGVGHEQFETEFGKYIIVNSKFISTEGNIFRTTEKLLCPLKQNDIAIVMSDIPNGMALAKCFIINVDKKYTLNQRIGGITIKNHSSKFYFYYLSRNPYFLSFDSGSGQTNLRKQEILDCPIVVPQLKEQRAISQILSDMDTEIATLEQQLQKAQALKQGVMQELLTGKTRLVEPTVEENTESLLMAAEPAPIYKKETEHKKHNEHINDAVLIGAMAHAFGSEQFPLTRFMYSKVSYLLKRYKEEQDAGYLKKAAGPYKPKTRYGGAEKIALQNKYIKKHISNYKGKKYENFLAGNNVTEAIGYFKNWYGEDLLHWIDQFKYTKRDQLELWATVDMAIEDLKREGKPVNFETIKELINNHKEWRPKLKRPIFSDANIITAIDKIDQLFGNKK